jgi:hypothetical protein
VIYARGVKIDGYSTEECYRRWKDYLGTRWNDALTDQRLQLCPVPVVNPGKVRLIRKKIRDKEDQRLASGGIRTQLLSTKDPVVLAYANWMTHDPCFCGFPGV